MDAGVRDRVDAAGLCGGRVQCRPPADRLGRRNVLILSAVMFLLSALGAGAAVSSGWFIAARVVGGFAVGAASVISPAYIAEVAPARYRGRLATADRDHHRCLPVQLPAGGRSGRVDRTAVGGQAWRWMFWMQAAPSLLFLLLLLTIPESPRYLVVKRRKDDALRVLTGCSAATRPAPRSRRSMPRCPTTIIARACPIWKSRATGRIRPIVWVGVGLACFQQLVGINVVFYYGAVLWQAVGFPRTTRC